MTEQNTDLEPSPIPRGICAGGERTELYILCYKHLPKHRKTDGNGWNGLDVVKIAKEIGVSKQKVWEWMKKGRLPGQRVPAMVELEGSKLSFESLGPYINRR